MWPLAKVVVWGPYFFKSSLPAEPEITLNCKNFLQFLNNINKHQYSIIKKRLYPENIFTKFRCGSLRGPIVWGPLVLRLKVHTVHCATAPPPSSNPMFTKSISNTHGINIEIGEMDPISHYAVTKIVVLQGRCSKI